MWICSGQLEIHLELRKELLLWESSNHWHLEVDEKDHPERKRTQKRKRRGRLEQGGGTASVTEWFTEEHTAMTWKEFQKSKSELQQK